ncbi:MAG TPA: DUF6584 family protein, partial [Phycisphaerales bacterium]|nr:DUF6584 family protein [Phycisphaerales bacterium]
MSRIEDRLAEDERRGDLGTARRRLASLAATRGYDPAVIERVARLSVRMGDWYEAGRWYAIVDSTDAEAPLAIERFQAAAGGPEVAAWRIPLAEKVRNRADLPLAVRDRLGKRLESPVTLPDRARTP